MDAFGLPKDNDEQKAARKQAIQAASKYATEVPFRTLQTAAEAIPLLKEMAEKGNPNSLSDAGVGASCLLTAMQGAWMNVLINAQGLDDKEWATQITEKAESIFKIAESACNEIILDVQQRLKGIDQ